MKKPLKQHDKWRYIDKIVYSQKFILPPEFDENGWQIVYSKDKEKYQLQQGCFKCWMGNGPEEVISMAKGAVNMYGNCLILGLGSGLIVQYIDFINHCDSLTIVEKEKTVIKNIEPWLRENIKMPFEIIQSDDIDFLLNTNRKWDTMYADTWELCVDALKKISTLKEISKDKIRGRKDFWAEKRLKFVKKHGYDDYHWQDDYQ